MSAPSVFYFPASTAFTDTISSAATYGAAGNLTLNSNNPDGSYTFPYGMRRNLSFYSPGDLSGLTITIEGYATKVNGPTTLLPDGPIDTYYSGLTAESITATGLNNATIYSSYLFKTITKITISGAAASTIQVGFGNRGYSQFYMVDYNRTYFNMNLNGQILDGGGATWGVLGSPVLPATPNLKAQFDSFPEIYPTRSLITFSQATTTGASLTTPYACTWGLVKASSASAALAGRFYFTFLQQGIT